MKRDSGFTLIEALVAITLIGILAGFTVSVIDIPRKRAEAEDVVKLNQLESLVSGLNTAKLAEGRYPIGTIYYPYMVAVEPIIDTYIESWPEDYLYIGTADWFYLSVPKSTGSGGCYRYYNVSSYPDEIESCTLAGSICWFSCTSL